MGIFLTFKSRAKWSSIITDKPNFFNFPPCPLYSLKAEFQIGFNYSARARVAKKNSEKSLRP